MVTARINHTPGLARRTAQKGQGTLEYLLVFAAILAALIIAIGSVFNTAMTNYTNDTSNIIGNAANKMKNMLNL